MKEIVKACLDRYNNTSHSNVELSNLIIGAIKTNGWYLNLNNDDICEHNNDLNSTCSECDELQARESWVCSICGKSTYEVDYDYLVHPKLHLSCVLKEEAKGKDIKEQYLEASEKYFNDN